FPVPSDPFSPPSNPPAPPFKNGLLPMVLVNNSGYPDSQVYVVLTANGIKGKNSQSWGQIDISYGSNYGVATLVKATVGENATSYSYPLSALPRGSSGRVIYLPQLQTGLVWFSIGSPLNMPVVAGGIQHPSYTNPTDPNYATVFDSFELTYLASGSPQISTDASAVSAFSMPLYGYLAGATSVSSNTGLYQPRSYIMNQLATTLATAKEYPQWDQLILKQNGKVLRCLSPGQSISASAFDRNYLDDSASYGYSYLSDLYAYYDGTPTLNMTVLTTVPSATYNYVGTASGNVFTFTSSDPGADTPISFRALNSGSTPTSTTTYNIFEGLNLFDPVNQPVAGTAKDAVSKLFQEAIMAGILPTTNTVSLASLVSNQAGYYKVNPLLSGTGTTTGPWYNLYSKALHALGYIYTFAYDDALWPQVLLGGPFVNNSTYLGITIGNSQ
ncbi:MAG: beta-1,3-glucanase family protein, partial [Chlamydiota bacterium]